MKNYIWQKSFWNKKNVIRLLIAILPIVLTAVLGGVFNRMGMDWYDSLNKPSQWIPGITFSIVWSVVYGLFVFVNFKIAGKPDTLVYFILFGINCFLNVLWCLLFFALNLTFIGLLVIVLNLIFAFLLLIEMKKIDNLYSIIMFIYPVWLSFATALNLALWILN